MSHRPATPATAALRSARDLLHAHATDYAGARETFRWPELDEFNFALEWFDVVAAENPDRPAVQIVSADLSSRTWTYGELSRRSDQVANWLRGLGIRRGDHVIVMLGNTIDLWETMLGLTKLGAVAIPTSTLLSPADLAYRAEKGEARAVVTLGALADRVGELPDEVLRIAVRDAPEGWQDFADASQAAEDFVPDGATPARDTSLLYFTSGTTSRPKLVQHSHVSYPVGHLSTMWWLGLREGDVHLNISSPGWAKHAWSSFYSPFLAEATVFVYNYDRFDADTLMDVMDRHEVTTFCAPPTVWRMLIQADLGRLAHPPRELVGAGEPLNPEVIGRVRDAWGGTIRDGFGQTERRAWVGRSAGQVVEDGSMGRPLPGYPVVLVDPVRGVVVEDPDGAADDGSPAEGEICLDLSAGPRGLMVGYYRDPEATARSREGGFHHTGDIATRDAEGYLTYVGRADDVFKASDYKISPFELESVLLEHPDVVEAAVVPSPDPTRLAVPKAYVCLSASAHEDPAATAGSIFAHARTQLSPHQWVRIIEFVPELPKTISGKIRRVDLRAREAERVAARDETAQHHDRDHR